MAYPSPGQSKAFDTPQCYNCGSFAHWAVACPEATRARPAGFVAWQNSGSSTASRKPLADSHRNSKGPIITRYGPPPPIPPAYHPTPYPASVASSPGSHIDHHYQRSSLHTASPYPPPPPTPPPRHYHHPGYHPPTHQQHQPPYPPPPHYSTPRESHPHGNPSHGLPSYGPPRHTQPHHGQSPHIPPPSVPYERHDWPPPPIIYPTHPSAHSPHSLPPMPPRDTGYSHHSRQPPSAPPLSRTNHHPPQGHKRGPRGNKPSSNLVKQSTAKVLPPQQAGTGISSLPPKPPVPQGGHPTPSRENWDPKRGNPKPKGSGNAQGTKNLEGHQKQGTAQKKRKKSSAKLRANATSKSKAGPGGEDAKATQLSPNDEEGDAQLLPTVESHHDVSESTPAEQYDSVSKEVLKVEDDDNKGDDSTPDQSERENKSNLKTLTPMDRPSESGVSFPTQHNDGVSLSQNRDPECVQSKSLELDGSEELAQSVRDTTHQDLLIDDSALVCDVSLLRDDSSSGESTQNTWVEKTVRDNNTKVSDPQESQGHEHYITNGSASNHRPSKRQRSHEPRGPNATNTLVGTLDDRSTRLYAGNRDVALDQHSQDLHQGRFSASNTRGRRLHQDERKRRSSASSQSSDLSSLEAELLGRSPRKKKKKNKVAPRVEGRGRRPEIRGRPSNQTADHNGNSNLSRGR